jgi:hypothetical protein
MFFFIKRVFIVDIFINTRVWLYTGQKALFKKTFVICETALIINTNKNDRPVSRTVIPSTVIFTPTVHQQYIPILTVLLDFYEKPAFFR